jgi:hypothetical protein
MTDEKKSKLGWSAILVTISGWTVALFLGVLELPAKINSFSTQLPKSIEIVSDWLYLDKSFSGNWTSEGNIDADSELTNSEGAPVSMQVRVYNGEVTGEIVSEGLKDHYIYSRIFIRGKKSGAKLQVEMFDYIAGKPTRLAVMEIEHPPKNVNDVISMKLVDQFGTFLPKEARLYRTADELPSGQINFELIKSALGAESAKK